MDTNKTAQQIFFAIVIGLPPLNFVGRIAGDARASVVPQLRCHDAVMKTFAKSTT